MLQLAKLNECNPNKIPNFELCGYLNVSTLSVFGWYTCISGVCDQDDIVFSCTYDLKCFNDFICTDILIFVHLHIFINGCSVPMFTLSNFLLITTFAKVNANV